MTVRILSPRALNRALLARQSLLERASTSIPDAIEQVAGYRRNTRRPATFSVGTYLFDGRVVAAWSLRNGRIELDPFESIASRDRRAVDREREALEAFHA